MILNVFELWSSLSQTFLSSSVKISFVMSQRFVRFGILLLLASGIFLEVYHMVIFLWGPTFIGVYNAGLLMWSLAGLQILSPYKHCMISQVQKISISCPNLNILYWKFRILQSFISHKQLIRCWNFFIFIFVFWRIHIMALFSSQWLVPGGHFFHFFLKLFWICEVMCTRML